MNHKTGHNTSAVEAAVFESKYKTLKGSALEYTMYPRCEYRTRFNGTSLFDMRDPQHWRSFYRSTGLGNCNRVADISEKARANRIGTKRDGDNPLAKIGIMKNPFGWNIYQTIFYDGDNSRNFAKENGADFTNGWHDIETENSSVYDKLLEYKCALCAIATEEYQQKCDNVADSNIKVYHQNEYPCIMVHVKAFNEVTIPPNADLKYVNCILMAYFAGIINHEAYMQKIPIELVNRSSFGHNVPSIDVSIQLKSIQAYRINVGLVPEIYVRKVLVNSFIKFNKLLPKILNGQIEMNAEEVENMNNAIGLYNQSQRGDHNVEPWTADDTFLDVLCKVGDASGEPVSFQFVKERHYIDVLINYALEELMNGGSAANLMSPLKKLLMELSYGEDVSLKIKDVHLNRHKYLFPKIDFHSDEKVDEIIQNDLNFWAIIEKISVAFEMRSISTLSNAVANRRMHGIYRLIEEANLKLIMNSCDQNLQDGYGSDSDCEIEIPMDGGKRKVFRSKKITNSTGIRTFFQAAFLVKYHFGIQKFNYDLSYIETRRIIELVLETHLDFKIKSRSDQTVRFIDLNYRNGSGNLALGNVDLQQIKCKLLSELNGEQAEAIIFDYTSASTQRIRTAIELFLPHARAVLFVNSGLKNEQFGADINTYGTLRILSDDSELVDRLTLMAKSILTTLDQIDGDNDPIELPKQAHNIRKCYKRIGATVTSAAIFKGNGWVYKKIEKPNGNVKCITRNCGPILNP